MRPGHRPRGGEDLDLEAARLLLRRHLLDVAEDVPKVDADLAEAGAARDRRVVARLAALHVVRVARRVAGALAVRLEHADGREVWSLPMFDGVLLLLRLERARRRLGQELVLAAHDGVVQWAEASEIFLGDDLLVQNVAQRRS